MNSILNPTYTIFKSRKFSFEKEDDNRYVKATEDIYEGDLLLIEHGIYDDTQDQYNAITNNLLYNEQLFNEIYPRDYEYNLNEVLNPEGTNDKFIEAITNKIQSNVFKHEIEAKVYHTLLRDGIKFNHSKEPNVNHHYIKINLPNLPAIVIFFFICYKDIKEGEELFINYGNGYFEEDTDLTDYNDKNKWIFTKNKPKINRTIENYLQTPYCRDVVLNHHLINKGLVYIQSQQKYLGLPKFSSVIGKEEITHKDTMDYINLQLLNIITTLKKIKRK